MLGGYRLMSCELVLGVRGLIDVLIAGLLGIVYEELGRVGKELYTAV